MESMAWPCLRNIMVERGEKKRGVDGDGVNLSFERHKGMGSRGCMVVLNQCYLSMKKNGNKSCKILERFKSMREGNGRDGIQEV
jgi:hypothetical protein